MKIGIVTFHADANYGAVWQAYALQTYLEKTGHSPFFVRWSRYENVSTGKPRTLLSRIPRQPVQKVYRRVFRRSFRRFSGRHLKSSEAFYPTWDELSENPPDAEAYICGSDQIWNPRYVSTHRQPIAWLQFGHEDALRIAYAPSFGRQDLDDELRQRWALYARGLDAVSVREEEGLELMKKLGRDDAVWVPDPTLLLSPPDYKPVESASVDRRDGYQFSYMIQAPGDNDGVYVALRNRIRRRTGLPVWECRPRRAPLRDLLTRKVPSPEEWLARLHCAAFVITNSFHGLMFSLLFRRPFIAILRTGAGAGLNTRLESILRIAGLEHRAVTDYDADQCDALCQEEIDWDSVSPRLAGFSETGQRFLQSALA